MSSEQLNEFLRVPRIAALSTLDANGAPVAVPIWIDWDGERVRLFTDRGSAKIRRIRADPRVCIMVAEPVGVNEAWVAIEGEARVIEHGAMELAAVLARRYYAPEKAEATIRDWEQRAAEWVVVEITPHRIRSMAPE